MGWASQCSHILYSPGNLPIPVNLSGNFLIKSWVDWMHLGFDVLAVGGFAVLAAWVCAVPVRLLLDWVVLTAQFTWTTANFPHAGRPKRAGPGVPAMYQYEWIMCGWAPGVFGCQRMGPQRFHTEESETHCRQLAWFKQGPHQWAGHLGWFVLDAAVGTDRGVVCYLQIWCQSWHRLRWCLYCWHLQAVWWLCMLHCTAGNWCCWWSSPLGAHLLPFHSPLQQWTGLVWGLFSVLALAACGSLPFSQFLKQGWWWNACGLVVLQLWHFTLQWPFFPQPLHAELWAWQLFLPGGCSWVQLGMVCRMSVAWDHVSGGHDVQYVPTCCTHIAATPDSTA